MSYNPSYPSFVKASWLADVDMCEYFEFTQPEIDLAMVIYNDLDRKICKSVIRDHGKSVNLS